MFILKKTFELDNNLEEFKSEEQAVVTNFLPVFNISTTKKSTSVVFSINFITRVVIIGSNGEKEIHKYKDKDGFNLKRRIFLNDKNVKAHFYLSKKENCTSNKKIKNFCIEHQL